MWEESKHPRDDDGRFTAKNGTPAEHKRLRELQIEDEKEFVKEMHNQLTNKEWENSLSKPQKESIKNYSSFGNVWNRQLWNNKQIKNDNIELLDQVIASYELKEPIIVYRNLPLNNPLNNDFIAKGYTSTSIDREKTIRDAQKGHNIVHECHIPKGKGFGAYINNLTSDSYKNVEMEFLLKRNSQFQYIDKVEEDGVIYIQWRVK